MKSSLRWQITLALVLFGLVPAATVAWFAYQSHNDFKEKQRTLIQNAAASILHRIMLRQKDSTPPAEGTLAPATRSQIEQDITRTLTDFGLSDAEVIVTNAGNGVLIRRKSNSEYD